MREIKWNVLNKKNKGKLLNEEIIDILLDNRGIKTTKEINEFFITKEIDKLTLKDFGINKAGISEAIMRIDMAKKNKEKIYIYGDYDADGICATAVLWETLHELGFEVMPHIPERFSEGYGLNGESVDKLKKEDPNLGLIITVDNGIVAHEAIGVCKNLGVDVIVTDHHQKDKKINQACAIVHSTKVCGAAVVWVLSRELYKYYKKSEKGVINKLDLVAVGTITDQIELLGINRNLVRQGVEIIRNTHRVGIRALCEVAAIEQSGIGVYEIGFVIGPRINAMGRLSNGIEALRLLCTKNIKRAKELANLLEKTNNERQEMVSGSVDMALESVLKDKSKLLIVWDSNFNEGIIGLIASKLVEKHYKPAIVFSISDGIAKASARSVSGFNIIEAIRRYDKYLLAGGGHPMAAGFSIKEEDLEIFSREIKEYSKKNIDTDLLKKSINIDMELWFSQINWDLVKKLYEFQPTGIGNPQPTFISQKLELVDYKPVGKEAKHFKIKLSDGEREYDGIAFGLGNKYTILETGKFVDVIYSVEINTWNGIDSIQLKVKDLKYSSI